MPRQTTPGSWCSGPPTLRCTASRVRTRASSSPTWRARHRPCTSGGTAHAARQRTASSQRSWICSAAARVATASTPMHLLLARLACTLMINLRRQALQDAERAQACATTIRARLPKTGAATVRYARRVRVLNDRYHAGRLLPWHRHCRDLAVRDCYRAGQRSVPAPTQERGLTRAQEGAHGWICLPLPSQRLGGRAAPGRNFWGDVALARRSS